MTTIECILNHTINEFVAVFVKLLHLDTFNFYKMNAHCAINKDEIYSLFINFFFRFNLYDNFVLHSSCDRDYSFFLNSLEEEYISKRR